MRSTIFTIFFSLFLAANAHAWVIKSDFETGTLGHIADGRKTDPNSSGAYYAKPDTVYSNTDSHSGNQSAEAILKQGTKGEGWGLVWRFPQCTEGGDLWWRAWINFPADFQYATEHGAKGFRLRTWKADGSDGRFLNIYPKKDHILAYNWAAETKTFNENTTLEQITDKPNLSGWESVENYVKCSATPGKAIWRIWRNGVLWFEDTLTPTLMEPGGYIDRAILLTLYSSAQNSPVTQSVWIDDIIFTNERPNNTDSKGNPYIGVGDVETVAPPEPPIIK